MTLSKFDTSIMSIFSGGKSEGGKNMKDDKNVVEIIDIVSEIILNYIVEKKSGDIVNSAQN